MPHFVLWMRKLFSPNSSPSDALPLSPKIEMEHGWSCPDPSESDLLSTEDPN